MGTLPHQDSSMSLPLLETRKSYRELVANTEPRTEDFLAYSMHQKENIILDAGTLS